MNPRILREDRFQPHIGGNLWVGILNCITIGPLKLPPRFIGVRYLQFLRNHLQKLLVGVQQVVRERSWLQYDGAPVIYSRHVTDYLNESYPNHWIGRRGPIAWPPL